MSEVRVVAFLAALRVGVNRPVAADLPKQRLAESRLPAAERLAATASRSNWPGHNPTFALPCLVGILRGRRMRRRRCPNPPALASSSVFSLTLNSSLATNHFTTHAPYDILMLVVLVACTLFGLWKGMAWQLASLASLIVSYIVALKFSDAGGPAHQRRGALEPLSGDADSVPRHFAGDLAGVSRGGRGDRQGQAQGIRPAARRGLRPGQGRGSVLDRDVLCRQPERVAAGQGAIVTIGLLHLPPARPGRPPDPGAVQRGAQPAGGGAEAQARSQQPGRSQRQARTSRRPVRRLDRACDRRRQRRLVAGGGAAIILGS